MSKYLSGHNKGTPLRLVDGGQYGLIANSNFNNSTGVKNLDLVKVLERCGHHLQEAGLSENKAWQTIEDYFLPITDIDEIESRQEAVAELYENHESRTAAVQMLRAGGKLHKWTRGFHRKYQADYHKKTKEAGLLIDFVEAGLGLEARGERLGAMKSFCQDISATKDYQALKVYTTEIAAKTMTEYKAKLSNLGKHFWHVEGRDGMFQGPELVKVYCTISEESPDPKQECPINLLDLETRRSIYASLKDFQEMFKELMQNEALDGIIDKKEAKTFDLEGKLEEAMQHLGTGAMVFHSGEKKVKKAEAFFRKHFAQTLYHLDQLINEGLNKRMESLSTQHSKLMPELGFYYSLAKLGQEMSQGSEVALPTMLPMDKRKCNIIQGKVPSIVLREEGCVANSFYANPEKNVYVITGANNNGKTTFLRMLGQNQILAQVGGYVAARKANLSVVDGIFTSFNDKDKPQRAQGTFSSALSYLQFISVPQGREVDLRDPEDLDPDYVLSYRIKPLRAGDVAMAVRQGIHNFVTPHSLLLLDEIAIGSDSIATEEAIARALRLGITRGARMLVSTHYHPIAEQVEAGNFPNTTNLGARMKKRADGSWQETFRIIRGNREPSLGERLFEATGFTDRSIDAGNEVLREAGMVLP